MLHVASLSHVASLLPATVAPAHNAIIQARVVADIVCCEADAHVLRTAADYIDGLVREGESAEQESAGLLMTAEAMLEEHARATGVPVDALIVTAHQMSVAILTAECEGDAITAMMVDALR